MDHKTKQFIEHLNQFFEDRDWKQFHSPKNIIMDLCSEIGELTDHFRWLTEEESFNPGNMEEVKDEIGDIFMMLLYLIDRLGVDPLEAAQNKLKKLALKYPAELCRGRKDKYHAYETAANATTSPDMN